MCPAFLIFAVPLIMHRQGIRVTDNHRRLTAQTSTAIMRDHLPVRSERAWLAARSSYLRYVPVQRPSVSCSNQGRTGGRSPNQARTSFVYRNEVRNTNTPLERADRNDPVTMRPGNPPPTNPSPVTRREVTPQAATWRRLVAPHSSAPIVPEITAGKKELGR